MTTTRARTSKSFILCLNMKTIRAKQAKVHSAYFVQRSILRRIFRCSCPRRQQEPRKFAYLTMKNNSFVRFARAVFHFWTFGRRSRSFHDVK